MKIKESIGEYGCRGAHFVLLEQCNMFYLATERLEDGLKVHVDDERRLCTILILVELDLCLFGAWQR